MPQLYHGYSLSDDVILRFNLYRIESTLQKPTLHHNSVNIAFGNFHYQTGNAQIATEPVVGLLWDVGMIAGVILPEASTLSAVSSSARTSASVLTSFFQGKGLW